MLCTWNFAFFLGTLSYELTCLRTSLNFGFTPGLFIASWTFWNKTLTTSSCLVIYILFWAYKWLVPEIITNEWTYLHPLLLLNVTFIGLGLVAFATIFLVFADAFVVVLVVISPAWTQKVSSNYLLKALTLIFYLTVHTAELWILQHDSNQTIHTKSLFHNRYMRELRNFDISLHACPPELSSTTLRKHCTWKIPFCLSQAVLYSKLRHSFLVMRFLF